MSDLPADAAAAMSPAVERAGASRGASFAGLRRTRLQPAIANLAVVAAHYRRTLILAIVIPALLGLYAAITAAPAYVATERLLVLLGSEYVYQPEVGQAGSGTTLDRNQIMQSELEILQSEYLRAATVRKIGIANLYPDLDPAHRLGIPLTELLFAPFRLFGVMAPVQPGAAEAEAAERLRRSLTITAVPQTNVIELSFRSTGRALSAEVLNTLVELYFQRRADVFRPAQADGGAAQDRQADQRLQDAEAALARFSEEHQIASFDAQLNRLIDQQAATSSDQLRNAQTITELQAQIAALRGQVVRLPRSVELYAETERPLTALDDLVRLENTYRTMSQRYQPGAPQMQAVGDQLARARADAARSQQLAAKGDRRGQNPEWLAAATHLEQAEVDLQGALGRQKQLQQSLDAINARLAELNAAGARYRDLLRARDVLAETFRVYSHNREEARLADALDRGRLNNIRVVQPAVPPMSGSANRAILLAGGILAGLVLAAALLAVLNALRQTMLSVADVERELELPVLVAVPYAGARDRAAVREPGPQPRYRPRAAPGAPA